MKRYLWTCLCGALVCAGVGITLAGKPPKRSAILPVPDKQFDTLLDEVAAETTKSAPWWDRQWRFRRQIMIDDVRLTDGNPMVIVLADPDPLLLANTGRCRTDGRDIRLCSDTGEMLPCGVVNSGVDDGSSMVWTRLPPAPERSTRLVLTIYYDNPAADTPSPGAPAGPYGEPINATVGPEETQAGDAGLSATNTVGQFVVVEAEKSCDADGKPLLRNRKISTTKLVRVDRLEGTERASGGAYLAPTVPWRPEPITEPVEAWTQTTLPTGGVWQVHVRYKINPAGPSDKGPAFHPFTLILGDAERTVGTNLAAGAQYRWDSFQANLPAGELPIGFRMPAVAGPDCVLFTREAGYRPDFRDFNGPVQMRFKVTNKVKPFFIEMFCVIQPWSSHGPQGKTAGYLFKEQEIRTTPDAFKLAADPKTLIQPGEWSPWMRAMHSQAPNWWTTLRFHAPDQRGGSVVMKNLKVSFEFASRPDPWRVVNRGTEDTGPVPALMVQMPWTLDKYSLFKRTRTFTQAARERYQLIEALNLKPDERPKTIFLTTMVTSSGEVGAEEADLILRTCGLLGFNGIEARTVLPPAAFWKAADDYGLSGTAAHYWCAGADWSKMRTLPPAGETCEQAFVRIMDTAARACYSKDSRRWNDATPRTRLIILGDEIGPAIRAPFLVRLPLAMGFFHEYLQSQGLSPEFFGKQDWSELKPEGSDYIFPKGSEAWKALVALDPSVAQIGQEALPEAPGPETIEPGGEFDLTRYRPSGEERSIGTAPPAAAPAPSGGDLLGAMQAEEDRASADLPQGDKTGSVHEKRLHYWTQRFRSYYTAVYYRSSSREIRRVSEAGAFRTPPRACPNFQALPIMRAQMWEGALNLFEWGRMGATDFMAMEDWNWDPYRIAFGMEILRAAARNRGQEVGALIVGGTVKQRFLADLGNGSRSFLSYVYGPLRVIGPPWAEDARTVKDWSELTRWVARSEPDLLAATNRPCDAAILVANTSEINLPWLNPSFSRYPLIDRASMFIALRDAGVPAEVVGEEEVVNDKALARYKILYVSDPHVTTRCQEKIKDWVREGGVLWSSYAALARNEYDEPSPMFDDVFGLQRRPALQPSKTEWAPDQAEVIKVAGGGLFPSFTFKGIPYRPGYELSTGKPLAVFTDGSPAMIENAFGQGKAYLLGCMASQLAGEHSHKVGEPPEAALKRSLLAAPARAAGVRLHLSLDHARVIWYVHDGPQQTVVFLASCFNADIPSLTVRVNLPRKPVSAYSGRLPELPFTWEGGQAVVNLPINMLDGELLVFRYADGDSVSRRQE